MASGRVGNGVYPQWAPWQLFEHHAGKDYLFLGHAIFVADPTLCDQGDQRNCVWLSDVMLPHVLTVYPVSQEQGSVCDTVGQVTVTFPKLQSSIAQRAQTLRIGLVFDEDMTNVLYGCLLVNRRTVQAAWRSDCIVPCVADMLSILHMFHKQAVNGLAMLGHRIQQPPIIDATSSIAGDLLCNWVKLRLEYPVVFSSSRRPHTVHVPGTTVSLDVEHMAVIHDEIDDQDRYDVCNGGVVVGYGAPAFGVALAASKQMTAKPAGPSASGDGPLKSGATLVVVAASSVASRVQQLAATYPAATITCLLSQKDFDKLTWRAVRDADYVVTTSAFLQGKAYLQHMLYVLNNIVSAPDTARRLLRAKDDPRPLASVGPTVAATKTLKRKRGAGGNDSVLPAVNSTRASARRRASASTTGGGVAVGVDYDEEEAEMTTARFFNQGKALNYQTSSLSSLRDVDARVSVVPYWVTCARRILAECPASADLLRPVLELLQFRAIVQADVDRQATLNVKRMRVFAQASWLVVSSIPTTYGAAMAKWDLALPRCVSEVPNVYGKFEMLYNNMLLHVTARAPAYRVVKHVVPTTAREHVRRMTYKLAKLRVPSTFKYNTTSMATTDPGMAAAAATAGLKIKFANQGEDVTNTIVELSRMHILDLIIRREQISERLRDFSNTQVALDMVEPAAAAAAAEEGGEQTEQAERRTVRRTGTIELLAREHLERSGTAAANARVVQELSDNGNLAMHASFYITNALQGSRMVPATAAHGNDDIRDGGVADVEEYGGEAGVPELNTLTYEYFEDEEDDDEDEEEYEEEYGEDYDEDEDDEDDEEPEDIFRMYDEDEDDDDVGDLSGDAGGPEVVEIPLAAVTVDDGQDGATQVPLLNEQAVLMYTMSVNMMESDIKKLDDIIANKQQDAKALVTRVVNQVATALNKTTCSVCCSDLLDSMLPCGHTMCHACAFEWMPHKTRCPLCTASHNKQLVVLLSGSTPDYPGTMNPQWARHWTAAFSDNTLSTFVFWLRSTVAAVEAAEGAALILGKSPAECKLLCAALADEDALLPVRAYGGPYASRRASLAMLAKAKAHVVVPMTLLLEGSCFTDVTHVVFPRDAAKPRWNAYLNACLQCVAPRAGGSVQVDTFIPLRPASE